MTKSWRQELKDLGSKSPHALTPAERVRLAEAHRKRIRQQRRKPEPDIRPW